jgi:cytochrome P450
MTAEHDPVATGSAAIPSDFDPTEPACVRDPHTMYRRLRTECPVAHSDAYGGFWTLARLADIERVVTSPDDFSSQFGIIVPRNPASGRRPPMHYDPPEHTAFRKAINPSFRKDRLARLEPGLRAAAAEVVAAAVQRGEVDAFTELASPLCARSVMALLNVPDHLAAPLAEHGAAFEHAQFAFDGEAVERENQILYGLARELVAHRHVHPLDPDEDIVSGLLAGAVDGVPIDDETVAGSFRQILIAGHGAPALVMASAIAHLADHPDLQDQLRAQPHLIPDAVEELLRLYTPNQGFARTVMRDVTVGDRTIPEGDVVTIPYTSANRDEAVFDRPDDVVLGRTERHVAFGFGVHVCPGSHIGRVQTRMVLDELLAASTGFEVTAEPTYAPFPVYGPVHLPLRIHR